MSVVYLRPIMIARPDYVKENMHKLFIGIATVLVLLVPATIFTYIQLPKIRLPEKVSQTKEVQKEPIASLKYTNPQYKYSLFYPKEWKVVTAQPTDMYVDTLLFENNTSASAAATLTQKVPSTIGIRAFQNVGPGWESTKAYFDTLLKEPMGETKTTNGRIVKLANVRVAGLPAVMLIEEGKTPEGLPYFTKNVYVFANNVLFAIMNSGENQKDIDKKDAVFNTIIPSVTFDK